MDRIQFVLHLLLLMVQPLFAVEIVAHRGSSHDYPENTIVAATRAWQEKADAVECDVRLSRDGRIVVIHDADTKRTTGTRGLIADLDLAALRDLDAGLWKGAPFRGTRIPTLDELLAIGPADRRYFVELKSGPAILPELRATLGRSGLPPAQVTLISFDLDVITAAKHHLPGHPCLWILSHTRKSPSLDSAVAQAKQAGLDGLDLSWKWPIDRAFVKKVRDAGLQLHVWTVDDLAVARRLADAGVDGITTNRPRYLREGLAQNNER